MRIAVLGPLEVRTDEDQPVAVPGAKERLLLAALAAEAPSVVSADRLAETLWDGDVPPSARKSLQVHVVRLRSALEPHRPRGSTGRFVVRRGSGYALAVDRDELDALRMTDLAARGRAHLSSGDADAAAVELRSALDLWRGEAYADWPDAGFAQVERRRLGEIRAAALASSIEADLDRGSSAGVIPELERLVTEQPLREDWWRLLMLALYRAGRQGDALAVGRRVREVLAEELGADPGPAIREVEAAILAQDPRLDLPRTASPAVGDGPEPPAPARQTAVCPYKGLAAYQPADAPLFSGRQRVVSTLVARLVDTPLVLVSGASGSGKSSVVRAGLVPALRQGALPRSEAWVPVLVVPGTRPVDALAGLTGESPPEAPVLLVVDQFEELWGPGVEPGERRAFLDAVLGLLDDGVVVRCVAVLRGDHVGRLAEHAPFTDRLGAALVLVPAPTDAELREIVLAPAAAVGLTVEAELVDAVVDDVRGRVGALPLLSTALVGTWERRQGSTLTLAGYLGAGGVSGALARSAEEAYASLDPPARDAARPLLVRLADVDDAGTLVRRRVPLAELDLAGDGGPRRREVVEAFVRRRLLALDRDRLEVAHEALLGAWPRLARWLDDDAAARAVRRHLAPAAREWERLGRPVEELYAGARLAAATDLLAAGADHGLTPAEVRFVEASEQHADAELGAALDRARREARARQRTRRLAQGLAVVLVAALVAAGLAVHFQRAADIRAGEAERASRTADANRLAALSDASASLDLGVLLAAQGFRLQDTPETRNRLLGTLAENPRVLRVTPAPPTTAQALLGADGQESFLATSQKLYAWDVLGGAGPRPIRQVSVDRADWPAVDASPTEPLLAAGGRGFGRAWLSFMERDGRERARLDGEALGGVPVGLAFATDGRRLDAVVAVGTGQRTAAWRLVTVNARDGSLSPTDVRGTFPGSWSELDADLSADLRTAVLSEHGGAGPAVLLQLPGGHQVRLPAPDRDARVVGYRALDTGVAQLWDDGEVTLYDRSGAVVQRLAGHAAAVRDVVLSPDRTWAATVGDGGAVVLWDVDPSSGRWIESERLVGHNADVLAADVDPAGRRLVTAAPGESVIAWDVGAPAFGTDVPAPPGRLAAAPAVVVPGRLLVAPTLPDATAPAAAAPGTGGVPVAATFLDPRDGAVRDRVDVGETAGGVVPEAFAAASPDGRLVAVTAGLTTTVLDARTRRVLERLEFPADGDTSPDGRALRADLQCCAAWTPDGSRLVVATEDDAVAASGFGELLVVDTATWRVAGRYDAGSSPHVVRTSPDGRWIAVAGGGQSLTLLDARTIRVEVALPLDERDEITDVSFSRDGRFLASVGASGRLRVFDLASRSARGAVQKLDGSGVQVEWLPDDRTIAVADADGAVSLFDVDRPLSRLRVLARPDRPGAAAHLVPDPSDDLVVLRDDGTGHRYPLDPAVWLRDACTLVGRDLGRAEWARYLPGRAYRPTCSDL